jgi:leucyl-tRNA synthetase
MRLFERIEEFDAKSRRANRGALAPADARAIADALTVLAQLLTPFAPHAGEELWLASGAEGPVTWPAGVEMLRKPVAS